MSKQLIKTYVILSLILLIGMLLSLVTGPFTISIHDVVLSLFNQSSPENNNIILNVRLPRMLAAVISGSTLALSGLLMRYTFKNPLADTSVLGVQSGASAFAMFLIIYFPLNYFMLPLVAFMGGMIALSLTLLAGKTSKSNSMTLILSGIAVNAFFMAIIGVLTILNPRKLNGILTYINGSLVSMRMNEVMMMFIFALIMVTVVYKCRNVISLLHLEDYKIADLGYNANKLRLFIAILAVCLTSITIAYVGIINFIGIIISNMVINRYRVSLTHRINFTMLFGAIFLVYTDMIQKVVFNPIEIPVGLVIGLISAPIFIKLIRSNNGN